MKDQKKKDIISNCKKILSPRRPEWLDVFNAIGHPALVLDPHHHIIAANRAAVELSGKTLGEILGQHCYKIHHGSDSIAPPSCCPMETMMKSGRLETVEMEIETLGGFFLVSCTPVFDRKGNLEKIIHIATDITERKQGRRASGKSAACFITF
jgi:PAS domain S-box-containing protein